MALRWLEKEDQLGFWETTLPPLPQANISLFREACVNIVLGEG